MEKVEKHISVRVTDKEKYYLDNWCEQYDLTTSQGVRKLVKERIIENQSEFVPQGATIKDVEKAINRLNFLEMQYIYKNGKIIVDVTSEINYDSIRVIVSDESILKLAKEWEGE